MPTYSITHKLMCVIAVIGILIFFLDRLTSHFLWSPAFIEIINVAFSLFVIMVGFFRWKPTLFFFACISPWHLYQGISSIFFDSSQVLFHAPVFLKKYFYILYAIGVTSGILCIFLALITFIGLIFWRKKPLQKNINNLG